VSLLGEGGMGTVYLAVHAIMGRKAAVKVLKPELARDESLVRRFFNEARAANAIRHPNIIDVIDVGILPEGDVPYMLMEFLEGESLATRLERAGRLTVAAALEVAVQTASALEAAHSMGIVHRDLKPDNLFLVPDPIIPSGERVKVLDFGIAKLRDDMRGTSSKTRTGAVMGTAVYMSPEQCQGLIDKVDHRTDVYALGIILYQMLCGAPPFLSEGFGELIVMHVTRAPEPPQKLNPEIPDAVAAAIVCALAKNPNHRFQSMVAFQAALRSHASAAPSLGASPTVRTAILDEPPHAEVPRPSAHPPMAPKPSSVPTLVEPVAVARPSSTERSTTFRTAAGELRNTGASTRGARPAVMAIAGVVGLAAAGLIVTLLVTGQSQSSTSNQTTATAPPAPLPPPPAAPTPPPAAPETVPAGVPTKLAPEPPATRKAQKPRSTKRTPSAPLKTVDKKWPGETAPHRAGPWW
jgi:serine/threonine-protein kinase